MLYTPPYMDIRIPDSEIAREIYQRGKILSDELISKAKHFYAEIGESLTNKLGHVIRYHKRQKDTAALASLSQWTSVAVAFLPNNLGNNTFEFLKRMAQDTYHALSAVVKPINDSLSTKFTKIGVSEDVYNTLHEEVAEFENELTAIDENIARATDPNFHGPLTAEFENIRKGHHVFPLACQFHAHARLAEKGIECHIQEGGVRSYAFPKEMVIAAGGDIKSLQNAPDLVHVFRDPSQKAPDSRQIVHRLDLTLPQNGKPALVPIPV